MPYILYPCQRLTNAITLMLIYPMVVHLQATTRKENPAIAYNNRVLYSAIDGT